MVAMTLSKDSHKKVVEYAIQCQAQFFQFKDYINKLTALDKAYYGALGEVSEQLAELQSSSEYAQPNSEKAKQEALRDIEVPIILSQVDTTTAYLMDIFLSGSPIFGVVAAREHRQAAAKLEAIIDRHATLGRWGSELVQVFLNGSKYDFTALECSYVPIKDISVGYSNIPSQLGKSQVSNKVSYINRLKALDLYNFFGDLTVLPSKISEYGEFAGYNEIISKVRLKQLTQDLSDAKIGINIDLALNTSLCKEFMQTRPEVSPFVRSMKPEGFSYDAMFSVYKRFDVRQTTNQKINYSSHYKLTTLYARIIPSTLSIASANPNHVQIWKFLVVNDAICISAQPIITSLDMFPIITTQFHDDGFGFQSKGVEERAMPWQDTASELLNVSLKGSRRAVSDRALYDPRYISPFAVNTVDPSPKIAIRTSDSLSSALSGNPLDYAYKAIPFDPSGTRGVMGDVSTVLNLAEYLHGQSAISQGVMKPGNRTLGEVNETLNKGENRLRKIALIVEDSLFLPIKYMVKANILQNVEEQKVISVNRKQEYEVNAAELGQALMEFKVADGLVGKARYMDPQAFQMTLNYILTVPGIAQQYDVQSFFADTVTAMGFPNIDNYAKFTPTETQPVQSQEPVQPQEPPTQEPNAPQA